MWDKESPNPQSLPRQLALRVDDALYYLLPDPTGQSLTLIDEQGNEAGHVLYNALGGVLTSTLSATLEAALSSQGALPDPATGLVHLGGGRFYDPALGRPLQPDPVGGPPSVPQALNRYGATSLGPAGVAEAEEGNGLNILSPVAWTSAAGSYALELTGLKLLVQSSNLTLRGSYQAIEQALGGKNIPYKLFVDTRYSLLGYAMLQTGYRVHPRLGRWLEGRLVNAYEARMSSGIGLVSGKAGRLAAEIDDLARSAGGRSSVQTSYRAGVLLKNALLTRAGASAGLAFLVDAGFEGYHFATGTGRWGNPYWMPVQKGFQAGLVIGSDALLAFGLALAPVDWPVAIGIAFLWSVSSETFFENVPYVGEFLYGENRNLQPLSIP